jgi:hypothetical protein
MGKVVTRVLWRVDITLHRYSEILSEHYTKTNQLQWYWYKVNVMYMSVQMCVNGGVRYLTALTNRGREWGRNVNRLSCQRHGRWWDANSERLVKHWLVLELHHRVQNIFCVWWRGIYNILSMSYHMLKFVADCVTKCIRGLLLVIEFLCLEVTFRLHLPGYNFLKMPSWT